MNDPKAKVDYEECIEDLCAVYLAGNAGFDTYFKHKLLLYTAEYFGKTVEQVDLDVYKFQLFGTTKP